MQVSVRNTGAYRKYVYLPAVAEAWGERCGAQRLEWNPEAFWCTRRYQFQVSEGEATADSMIPETGLKESVDSRRESYVKAKMFIIHLSWILIQISVMS